MKKTVAFVLICVMLAFVICSCGKKAEPAESSDKKAISAETFKEKAVSAGMTVDEGEGDSDFPGSVTVSEAYSDDMEIIFAVFENANKAKEFYRSMTTGTGIRTTESKGNYDCAELDKELLEHMSYTSVRRIDNTILYVESADDVAEARKFVKSLGY